jgi:mono/diheme cytochrome c family protein
MTIRPVGLLIFAISLFACVPRGKSYSGDKNNSPPPDQMMPDNSDQPDQQDSPMNPPDQPVVENPDAGMIEMPPADPPPVDPNALQYARDILPIMEEHCTECHHEGRQPDFVDLPADASLRDLIAARIIARGETTMPPSPRDHLAADELAKIQKWKDDGVNP